MGNKIRSPGTGFRSAGQTELPNAHLSLTGSMWYVTTPHAERDIGMNVRK